MGFPEPKSDSGIGEAGTYVFPTETKGKNLRGSSKNREKKTIDWEGFTDPSKKKEIAGGQKRKCATTKNKYKEGKGPSKRLKKKGCTLLEKWPGLENQEKP